MTECISWCREVDISKSIKMVYPMPLIYLALTIVMYVEELIRPHGRDFHPATNYATIERSHPTGGIPSVEVSGFLYSAKIVGRETSC